MQIIITSKTSEEHFMMQKLTFFFEDMRQYTVDKAGGECYTSCDFGLASFNPVRRGRKGDDAWLVHNECMAPCRPY